MVSRPIRRFTLMDAIILIAAMALACWLLRPYADDAMRIVQNKRPGKRNLNWLVEFFAEGIFVPVLAALTLAVLALRMKQPRPRLRLLARQAGFTASIAATVVIVSQAVFIGGTYLSSTVES